MAIKAGTKNDLAGSMAEDIELAFAAVWAEFKSIDLPEAGEEDRRMLYIAIAQGVVKHLKENAGESFDIAVETTQVTAAADEPLIESQNATITVTQSSGSGNMVKSRGSATVDELVTEGTLF